LQLLWRDTQPGNQPGQDRGRIEQAHQCHPTTAATHRATP
jgi:hypothetical protein